MSNIQVFNFEQNNVRTVIGEDGEAWFVANDVCAVLEINNPTQALTRLDEDEKDKLITNDSIGRERNTPIINESGL